MDELVDKTMANLKLIGMINKGEKICLRKGQLNIEYVDRLQSLRRWYNKDSRDVSIIHIRNTINDAIKIAKGLLSNSIQSDLKTWTVGALNSELRNCETGLQNLKTTYMDDQSFLANIDVLLDKCKAQTDEIDKGLFQLSDTSNVLANSAMSSVANENITGMKRGERSSRHIDTK
jgi:hypothetical protein